MKSQKVLAPRLIAWWNRPTTVTAKVYRSYRALKTSLGQLDAAHELSELALKLMTETAATSGNYEQFVSVASARLGLHVRVQSPLLAHRMVALSAIATVHGNYERFIADFVADATLLVGLQTDMGEKSDKVSKHDYLIGSLAKQGYRIRSAEFKLLGQVLEHFRLVRNAHVHRSTDRLARIEQIRLQIANSEHWATEFPGQPGPSEFGAVSFSDFLIFTNAVRKVARLIAEAALPTDAAIIEHPDSVAFRSKGRVTATAQRLFLRDRFALDDSSIEDIIRKQGLLV